MAEENEDKYERFFRYTDIDLHAEIAAGGSGGGLVNYYTKTESDAITDSLDDRITELEENPSGGGGVTDHGALTGLTDDDHPQYLNNARGDDRYYTKTQTDSNFATTGHNHDSRYYTESEINTFLAGKSDTNHVHDAIQITTGSFDIARIPTGTSGTTVSLGNHNHDSRYYTESEVDALVANKTNISDTPRYLMFNTTWPARPADSRMTFYIGGDPVTNAPTDSIPGDVWIPETGA